MESGPTLAASCNSASARLPLSCSAQLTSCSTDWNVAEPSCEPNRRLSALPSAGRCKMWIRLPGRANGKHSVTCERHESAAKVGEVGSVRFCLQIAGDGGNEVDVFLVEQPSG